MPAVASRLNIFGWHAGTLPRRCPVSAGQMLGNAVRLLEAAQASPAFCAVARRAAQASTSGAGEGVSFSLRWSSSSSFCTQSRVIEGQELASRQMQGLLSTILGKQAPAASGRPLSTLACRAPLTGCSTAGSASLANQPVLPARLDSHLQQRTAFGLPNLNGDTSKRYTERRLIGCGAGRDCMFAVSL